VDGMLVDGMLFVQGLVLGLSVAAPVGPIGLLCIRRTLTAGRLTGFVSGLGAATADLAYGCIAAFGLTTVTIALTSNARWLQLIGGCFLFYLGVQTFRANPATHAAAAEQRGLWSAYLSTLALTITNPVTILAFAAMFAAIGAGNTRGDYAGSLLVALGVFIGSAAWWLFLSAGVSLLRNRFEERQLRWVNWASGVMIVAFGVLAVAAAM
jgi:threonine/homoserine/homoserine lactone efflux protein